ncbi:nitrogenase reductase-like protein [Methanocaldococcus villosus KIN24-T80]|uniref:Nitrogenase iron protein n=1 Tax=Methanocaldococcus villosus KIN24-T80 TaxID=1069083 RepID=N6VSE0_9EURY|nr:nitrogenase iron protein [Methanocaldococcus villosus]ENN96061.1 nitrogenase reductase-like protein [Methanocaldococcus villosus KIN24-T80]
MKQIAFYGKGGIGKSTVVCNVAAALADNFKVMVVGCDPKHDCTISLRHGEEIPTVLDVLREKKDVDINDIVYKGYKGVYCVEAGGPKPGYGCAGRGVIVAIELLKKLDVFKRLGVDIVLYDILGDVVCGGFAMPLRLGLVKQIYIVTSSDYMAMYAANNICKGIKEFAKKGCRLAGLIYNVRGSLDAEDIVNEFAKRLGTKILEKIPNSLLISEAEIEGKTVIEYAPDSEIATIIKNLAEKIYKNNSGVIPEPLSNKELIEIGKSIKERIRRRL